MYDGACARLDRHKLHTNGNQTSILSHLGMTAVCHKIETGKEKQTFLGLRSRPLIYFLLFISVFFFSRGVGDFSLTGP